MAIHSPFIKATRVHAAVALCIASCASAWAQQNSTEITITDKLPARVSGFGDVPAQELPFSTTTITNATLQDIGARRVSDALHLDASVSDSYNSPAYWDILSVRGFTLDNRYNYRREGLPISAETMISMENKERIELLKGTSGIQAGTSSPGGLVNYVVKRAPTNAEQSIRNISLSYGQGDNRSVAADLGGRFGEVAEFGYRFNVAHEDLNPYIRNTKGHRDLVAIAMDWRLKPGTVIDFEFEQSHREQIGINGYSLLGGALPAPVDPRINLTRQAWSQPGVFDAMTGSVRVRQELDTGWRWTTQYGAQRLKTDDRLTYGFGCGAISDYSQYCADGSFDLYDFRSENERRLTDALQTEIAGKLQLGQLQHELTFGFSRQRQLDRMPPMQSYNYNNTPGSVFTPFNSSASPNYVTPNTNRSEYSTELSIKDRVQLSNTTSVWAGLRNVSYNRSSVQNEHTDQTVPFPYPDLYPNAKQFTGSINVPWIGISTRMLGMMTYASHGHGVEQFVTPNTASFGPNAGTQLGIGRSRQTEFGLRTLPSTNQLEWNAAVFQISRPYAHDLFDGPNYSTRYIDGTQTHQGLDLGATWRNSAWKLGAQTQWLHAKLTDVQQSPETVGSTPLNIPRLVLRGMAEYRYANAPGLRTGLRVSHEGQRNVTEDGGVMLPSWTTFDASAHYDTKVNNIASTWTLAIDNLEDKRYWRESPKQFGHYYLYPGAPRTIRATVLFRL
jgi:iron complex outermembrane receptor protein